MKAAIQLAAVLAGFALPLMAHAQDTGAARADGKAFGGQLAPQAQAAATTQPDAARVPGFSSTAAQSDYFDNPNRMSADSAAAASSNDGYATVRSSLDTRAKFDPALIKDVASRSKAISADPLQYTSGMGTSGSQGRCVPLPMSSASPGRYQASCNTGYKLESSPASCTIPLGVTITQNWHYQYYAESPLHTGLSPLLSQLQPSITSGLCSDLGAADSCQVAQGYGQTPATNCATLQTRIIRCGAQIAGLSGVVFPASGALWFARDATNTASTSRNESQCAPYAADPMCITQAETCTDSAPTTRTVGGVDVTASCWSWRRDYQCYRYVPMQDCDALAATPGCNVVSESCITGETPCRTFERVYTCPLPPEPSGKQQYICDGDVYCIDGACETITREANGEFKDAAVALNAMSQAHKEFDPSNLSLFKGERGTCSSQVFGIINCCKGKGFPLIPGISLLVALGCSKEEQLLDQRDAAGLCAYVGTYCSSSFLGICLTKQKVYCCFQSKLSRILQEQGRVQLAKPWGNPKTEQCLGFTVDEFARLDLSKMDFSEVYAEFTGAAKLPDELTAAAELQQKIEDYYAAHKP
ncbi:MAG: conjugal transfer protein TraN [Novosphingobium sp.]